MNSRLSQWAHSFRHLVSGNFIPDEVISAAEEFKPDLIFTIAGSWDWTTLMSKKLANKMIGLLSAASMTGLISAPSSTHYCVLLWKRDFASFTPTATWLGALVKA